MRTPMRLTMLALTLSMAIPAAAMGGATAARSHHVSVRNFNFSPSKVTIRRGDSVTWTWHSGSTAHNVTGSSFHSRTQSHGSFTVRFSHRGTFSYHCTIHPFMTGKIVVH